MQGSETEMECDVAKTRERGTVKEILQDSTQVLEREGLGNTNKENMER